MRAYVDAGKLPGMLTLVARGGKIVFLDVYGDRDVQRRRPLSEDTLFRIYSMTKPITSVAVMQLYEDGRFQLDDPVSAFLPELADLRVYVSGQGTDMRTEPQHEPVTIHHLLTHSSGLTYGFSNTGIF